MLSLNIEGLIGGTVDFLTGTLNTLLDFIAGGLALVLGSTGGLLGGL